MKKKDTAKRELPMVVMSTGGHVGHKLGTFRVNENTQKTQRKEKQRSKCKRVQETPKTNLQIHTQQHNNNADETDTRKTKLTQEKRRAPGENLLDTNTSPRQSKGKKSSAKTAKQQNRNQSKKNTTNTRTLFGIRKMLQVRKKRRGNVSTFTKIIL